MHDRFFDGRQLKCYYWDGKIDFKVIKESAEVVKERVDKFGDWLEGQDLPEEFQPKQETGAADENNLKEKRDAKLREK